MIVNAIFVPAVTAILFGLMPSEDVEGITTTFAVAEVPALSKTVILLKSLSVWKVRAMPALTT